MISDCILSLISLGVPLESGTSNIHLQHFLSQLGFHFRLENNAQIDRYLVKAKEKFSRKYRNEDISDHLFLIIFCSEEDNTINGVFFVQNKEKYLFIESLIIKENDSGIEQCTIELKTHCIDAIRSMERLCLKRPSYIIYLSSINDLDLDEVDNIKFIESLDLYIERTIKPSVQLNGANFEDVATLAEFLKFLSNADTEFCNKTYCSSVSTLLQKYEEVNGLINSDFVHVFPRFVLAGIYLDPYLNYTKSFVETSYESTITNAVTGEMADKINHNIFEDGDAKRYAEYTNKSDGFRDWDKNIKADSGRKLWKLIKNAPNLQDFVLKILQLSSVVPRLKLGSVFDVNLSHTNDADTLFVYKALKFETCANK